jgi:hypothetical protein
MNGEMSKSSYPGLSNYPYRRLMSHLSRSRLTASWCRDKILNLNSRGNNLESRPDTDSLDLDVITVFLRFSSLVVEQ